MPGMVKVLFLILDRLRMRKTQAWQTENNDSTLLLDSDLAQVLRWHFWSVFHRPNFFRVVGNTGKPTQKNFNK